jgi:hypothetical protein
MEGSSGLVHARLWKERHEQKMASYLPLYGGGQIQRSRTTGHSKQYWGASYLHTSSIGAVGYNMWVVSFRLEKTPRGEKGGGMRLSGKYSLHPYFLFEIYTYLPNLLSLLIICILQYLGLQVDKRVDKQVL